MSFTPEMLRVLEESLLFIKVAPSILLSHLDQFEVSQWSAEQPFLVSGEIDDRIHVILHGRLRIHLLPNDEPVEILGEGESLGEISLITDHILPYYVTADTDCTILSIDHRTMWSMIESSHQVARNLLNILMHHPVNNHFTDDSGEQMNDYVGMNHVDELTGLYNKLWMMEIFQRQIYRDARDGTQSTLLLAHLKNLDDYNAHNGRLGGDQALRTVAQGILSSLRPSDMAARCTGSTFAVLLPHTNLTQAEKAAARLKQHLDDEPIVAPSGDALPKIDIALILHEVSGEEPLEHLLNRAGIKTH